MATTKEIKNRIKSVKDTQKITNAMYLISSTKVRRAKQELEQTRPYFDLLKEEIMRVFRSSENATGKYFYEDNDRHDVEGVTGYLVITADKGLAGAYNQNIIRETLRLIEEKEPVKGEYTRSRVFVIGEVGRRFFMSHAVPMEEDFFYTDQRPTLGTARRICMDLLTRFDEDELQNIEIVYTDFKGGMSGGEVASFQLLPFNKKRFDEVDSMNKSINGESVSKGTAAGKGTVHDGDRVADGRADAEMIGDDRRVAEGTFEFEPSEEAVLDAIVPGYLTGFIYSALVDSFCSEQNARMTAMDSANENAQELLDRLSLEYNHVRQGAITQEITEISSGARGQKKNQEKKKKKKEAQLSDRQNSADFGLSN